MKREMCKSKIHRVHVTEANLFYSGSVTIDKKLMLAADIYAHEKVQIANMNSGVRLETYVIEGSEGSGSICLNGAAARCAEVGDEVLIISYASMNDEEAKNFRPKIVHVDQDNQIAKIE
jgi:aspartate 1-decarboxylase